jgi:hypothetical protein
MLFSFGASLPLAVDALGDVQTTRQGRVAASAGGQLWKDVHLLRVHGQGGAV